MITTRKENPKRSFFPKIYQSRTWSKYFSMSFFHSGGIYFRFCGYFFLCFLKMKRRRDSKPSKSRKPQSVDWLQYLPTEIYVQVVNKKHLATIDLLMVTLTSQSNLTLSTIHPILQFPIQEEYNELREKLMRHVWIHAARAGYLKIESALSQFLEEIWPFQNIKFAFTKTMVSLELAAFSYPSLLDKCVKLDNYVPDTLIYEAIKGANLEMVQHLMNHYNLYTNHWSNEFVGYAIISNNVTMLDYILNQLPTEEYMELAQRSRFVFQDAAYLGSIPMIQRLIEGGLGCEDYELVMTFKYVIQSKVLPTIKWFFETHFLPILESPERNQNLNIDGAEDMVLEAINTRDIAIINWLYGYRHYFPFDSNRNRIYESVVYTANPHILEWFQSKNIL